MLQTGTTLSPPQLGCLSIPQRPVPAGLMRGLSDLRGSVCFTGCPSANHPTPHGAQESGPDWAAQPLLTAQGHCDLQVFQKLCSHKVWAPPDWQVGPCFAPRFTYPALGSPISELCTWSTICCFFSHWRTTPTHPPKLGLNLWGPLGTLCPDPSHLPPYSKSMCSLSTHSGREENSLCSLPSGHVNK